jgi:hypothetical protein
MAAHGKFRPIYTLQEIVLLGNKPTSVIVLPLRLFTPGISFLSNYSGPVLSVNN